MIAAHSQPNKTLLWSSFELNKKLIQSSSSNKPNKLIGVVSAYYANCKCLVWAIRPHVEMEVRQSYILSQILFLMALNEILCKDTVFGLILWSLRSNNSFEELDLWPMEKRRNSWSSSKANYWEFWNSSTNDSWNVKTTFPFLMQFQTKLLL